MTGRERVLATISHREPDRVPVDLGGSMVTSMHKNAYENLKKYLGINLDRPTEIVRGRSLVARVDHEIQDHLGVDVRMLTVNSPDGWQDEAGGDKIIDEWGIVWERPPGFDNYEIVHSPLFGDISVDDVCRKDWPEPLPPGFTNGIRDKALALRKSTDKAILANLALQIHTQTYFLRGFSQYLMDMIMNPALIEAIMDRVLEIFIERARSIMAEIGDLVDIVYVADDLGMQNGPLFSPQLYRQILKPRQKKLFEVIKSATNIKILYHTCGSVVDFIDDLVEIGVDILNPVQVSAAGMDPKILKKRFGHKICFWGGVDSQNILPFGNTSQVKEAVKNLIEDLATDGGFVLAAVHNIRPEVPPENIIAMIEAVHEFGQYNK